MTRNRKPIPEYSIWSMMKMRCENPRDKGWSRYGARGITVCEKWSTSFVAFLEDVGRRPSRRHSLDRINNDGNYEPGNVRWADAATQTRNTRANRRLTWLGRTMALCDWATEIGVSRQTIYARLAKGLPRELVFRQKRSNAAQ